VGAGAAGEAAGAALVAGAAALALAAGAAVAPGAGLGACANVQEDIVPMATPTNHQAFFKCMRPLYRAFALPALRRYVRIPIAAQPEPP
jgi:hypothetical protein